MSYRYIGVAIVLSMLLGASCSSDATTKVCISQDDRSEISYLALGDSYTIGQGIDSIGRWPSQLSNRLLADSVLIPRVNYIAQTGWTTRNLINAIASSELSTYDLVSLLIGVNNQFQGIPISVFEQELEELLDTAEQLASGVEHVFVISIPDYGVTPFGNSNQETIAMEIDQYNEILREQCEARGIIFVDITDVSRALEDDPDALAIDQLHPSELQYSLWVDRMYNPIKDLILK